MAAPAEDTEESVEKNWIQRNLVENALDTEECSGKCMDTEESSGKCIGYRGIQWKMHWIQRNVVENALDTEETSRKYIRKCIRDCMIQSILYQFWWKFVENVGK